MRRHLHQHILHHFGAVVAALADVAHFADDVEKAVKRQQREQGIKRHAAQLAD